MTHANEIPVFPIGTTRRFAGLSATQFNALASVGSDNGVDLSVVSQRPRRLRAFASLERQGLVQQAERVGLAPVRFVSSLTLTAKGREGLERAWAAYDSPRVSTL